MLSQESFKHQKEKPRIKLFLKETEEEINHNLKATIDKSASFKEFYCFVNASYFVNFCKLYKIKMLLKEIKNEKYQLCHWTVPLPSADKNSFDWECLAKYPILFDLKLWFNNYVYLYKLKIVFFTSFKIFFDSHSLYNFVH